MLIAIILPLMYASAAPTPLVPCGRSDTNECTTCDFFQLIKNVLDYLVIYIVPPIAVLFFIIAGFFVLTAGVNASHVSRGKKIFWDTVIALFIIYGAWLITNTVLKILASNNDISNSWWSIECSSGSAPSIGQ